MRIQPGDMTNTSELNVDQTRQTRDVVDSTAPSSPKVSAGSPGSDSIALTGSSNLVQQAMNAGAGERASRVEQLKQLVQSGQYNVDPAALSSSMIDAHLAGE